MEGIIYAKKIVNILFLLKSLGIMALGRFEICSFE